MVKAEIERLEATWISPDDKLNSILENAGSTKVKSGANMAELVKRPELNYEILKDVDKDRPELSKKIQLHIPDENSRRVGQSVAAASLPKIK